ncbi:hypothetical protein MF406_12230 [Georgenia sp. TF02-10]|uniref:hypothetical protein n=1 Tax=Georgenia sp. TF02-10 TaxID=2917725 RepID=UPI001FA6B13A|nr:hypothetical protein [Georgenia sp. TF02-10]UNX53749.1 hypothetical protein MF406_12230 [Georgenia sp. TF02-10]
MLAPGVTAVIAGVAVLVAWWTLAQRRQADARAHWWDRTQWAIDQALDPREEVYRVGLAVMEVRARRRLMRAEEYQAVAAVWEQARRHRRRQRQS